MPLMDASVHVHRQKPLDRFDLQNAEGKLGSQLQAAVGCCFLPPPRGCACQCASSCK